MSVGADHLAELGSVVAQMVDTNHVITESIENLVQRITDNGTADVTDVKRLAMLGEEYSTMTVLFSPMSVFPNPLRVPGLPQGILDKRFFRNKHIDVSIDLLNLLEERGIVDSFRNTLGNERWSFSHDLGKTEAGKKRNLPSSDPEEPQ